MFLKNEKGMALVLAIMLLLVLFVMGSTLLMMSTTDVKIAGHQMRDNKALFIADAGIQEVLARITSDSFYVGDTVGYVRPAWQSEIYAGTPPAGKPDTLRFSSLGDMDYADSSSPVIIHYLKDRTGSVVFYDPDTKRRMSTGVPKSALPIYVAEATGVEPGGVYPVRRKAITEFIISTVDYDSVNYALHVGGKLYLKAISPTTKGRLATFSGRSDVISIRRDATDTVYIDVDYDGVRDVFPIPEANIFGGRWSSPNYDILRMPLSYKASNPLPHGVPVNLLHLTDSGYVFVNDSIILDTLTGCNFVPKCGETWLTGQFRNYTSAADTYFSPVHAGWTTAKLVPQINMAGDYWKYEGATVIDKTHPSQFPAGWHADSLGYHWTSVGAAMDSGTYYFADDNVSIDSAFDATGNIKLITPYTIYVYNDITYSKDTPKSIGLLAGQSVSIGNTHHPKVIVKALIYAKNGDLVVFDKAAILGAVIVGGNAKISGQCAIILDKRLTSNFQFVKPEKKYVNTVLSWREVRP
jgi:hypothetical protein